MTLTNAKKGQEVLVKEIGGSPETRQFLETLGFLPGEFISIINEIGGSLIVVVKGTRVAVSRPMAEFIEI
jgi:ferrous iron transport protein A